MIRLLLCVFFYFLPQVVSNEITLFYMDRGCYSYDANAIAYKKVIGDIWGEWSSWYPTAIKVDIDLENDIILIHSKGDKIFRIVKSLGQEYSDNLGGLMYDWLTVDQDNYKCKVKFRVDIEGNRQLYVIYYNVKWAYNLKKR